jgi:hypothetical protein
VPPDQQHADAIVAALMGASAAFVGVLLVFFGLVAALLQTTDDTLRESKAVGRGRMEHGELRPFELHPLTKAALEHRRYRLLQLLVYVFCMFVVSLGDIFISAVWLLILNDSWFHAAVGVFFVQLLGLVVLMVLILAWTPFEGR